MQRASEGIENAGADDRNVHGQSVALTVFSEVKWWGRVVFPVFCVYIRVRHGSLGKLRRLSFIHAARWAFVHALQENGSTRRLRRPLLFFESNFNGGWEEYIDAFSYVVPSGMWAFWGSSSGFPGAVPSGPFKDYIRRNEIVASHYYCAYPDATATIVLSGLEIAPVLDQLTERAASSTPAEFQAQWHRFLSEHARCL